MGASAAERPPDLRSRCPYRPVRSATVRAARAPAVRSGGRRISRFRAFLPGGTGTVRSPRHARSRRDTKGRGTSWSIAPLRPVHVRGRARSTPRRTATMAGATVRQVPLDPAHMSWGRTPTSSAVRRCAAGAVVTGARPVSHRRPAMRQPRHPGWPRLAVRSRTLQSHWLCGRGPPGLPHPARWRAQVARAARTVTPAPSSARGSETVTTAAPRTVQPITERQVPTHPAKVCPRSTSSCALMTPGSVRDDDATDQFFYLTI